MQDYFKIYSGENIITMVIVGAIVFFIFACIAYHYVYLKKKRGERDQIEELYQGIFNQVADSIFVLDENMIVQYVNESFLKYQEKSADKIIGKSMQRIPTDYDYVKNHEELKKAIAEKGFYEKRLNYFHSSGEIIPFHAVFKPLLIGNKKGEQKKYTVITGTDIKNTSEKDEYITRQEDELLEIQHLAHLGYWEMDYATKNIYWSQELYRILGYEEGEVEPNLDIIYWMAYEDDQNRVWKAFLRAFQAQEKVDTHYRLKNNRGEMLDIYLRIRHYFSKDNEHLRTIGILQDITKQADLREELNEQLIYTDMVLNNSRVSFVNYNINFEVEYINSRVSELSGISCQDAVGKSLFEIFGKLNRSQKKFINENLNFKLPMPLKDCQGRIHYIQWDYSAFNRRNGEITNSLLGIDVTDTIENRKELEASFVVDPVTKLPNRFKLGQVLDNYFEKNGQDFDKNIALLFIYIDGVFVVSDGLGQNAEDELIRAVSERLYNEIGKYGLFVRRYANQFVLFYPHDKNNEKITEICELIAEQMKVPFIVNGIPIKLGSHIGISKFPDHATNKIDLVRFGSGAMREAQRLNRDYYVYNESLEVDLKKQLNACKKNY